MKANINNGLSSSIVISMIVFLGFNVSAQCVITQPQDRTGCANTAITFNAVSESTTVNHHIWYDQYGTGLSPTTESKVEYSPGSGQVKWISSLTVYPTANTVYYVAASCNTAPAARKMVTYTVQTPNSMGLGMSPSSNPSDLCAGETITLTASNATLYEWRYNNPNDPSYSGGTTKTATQSGTYYLRGRDNCNQIQNQQITLNFKQPMSSVSLGGPDERCQVKVDDQYTTGGFNIDYVTWSIADNDPAANASISSNGKATWNNTNSDATITMVAWGCHGTNIPKTKTISVTRSPYNMQISTTQPNFCAGTVVSTNFNVTGNNYSSYRWESVTGTGNSIDPFTGNVTWNPNFTGTATVTGRAYGCGTSSLSSASTLTVFAKPNASVSPTGPVTIPFGTSSTVLNAASGSGYNFEWLRNTAPVAVTTSTYAASNTGNYTVRVTDGNGCTSTSNSVAVTLASNYNYILENTLQTYKNDNGTTILETDIRTLPIQKRIEQAQFIDGLGRPLQIVVTKNTPLGIDVVQPLLYDAYGREVIKMLPVALGNNGGYKPNILSSTNRYTNGAETFYAIGSNNKVADDSIPYAKTIFEPSPLNRVIEKGAPGAKWRPDATDSYTSLDKTKKFAYEANVTSEVIRWTFTPAVFPNPTYGFGTLITGSGTTPDYYSINELYKSKTKDEDGNETIEYKDKSERVVSKKVQVNATQWAQTFYIYDDLQNLVCVIPPEATSRLATEYFQSGATAGTRESFLDRWAFRYAYDSKRRLSMKQVPGIKPVFMIYDVRNRLILTQDGNQRTDATGAVTRKEWSYTKYDALNRPIIKGIYTHGSVVDQYTMQLYVNGQMTGGNKLYEDFDGSTAYEGYSNRTFPTTSVNLLIVEYYDNYTFKSSWPASLNYVDDDLNAVFNAVTYDQVTTPSSSVYSLSTGKKVKILDGGILGLSWLRTVVYYDDMGRVIQTINENQKHGEDRTSVLYDFAGKTLKSKTLQTNRAVTWTDATLLNITPVKMVSTNSAIGWSQSGAASQSILPAGQNGWVETSVGELSTYRMIGLSDVNTDNNYTTLDYAIYMYGNSLQVYENGTSRGTFTPALTVGEVLRAERTGTTITYKRNGVTFYTSTVPSSTQLIVDATFYSLNSTLNCVYASFAGGSTEINRRLEYDAAGRLIKIWHRLNSEQEILLVLNEFNELGQLVDKKLHSTLSAGSDAKQSVDYRYNIRGWLTSINDASLAIDGTDPKDHFGMELGYESTLTGLSGGSLYNGNISAIKWSNVQAIAGVKENAYTYNYDQLNRLKSSTFMEKATSWSTPAAATMAETNISYDLNGNILGLSRSDKRSSGLAMDNLVYDYGSGSATTNRLLKVRDDGDDFTGFIDGTNTTNDYTYDANGNMITDENKGINIPITYNHLNLPETVTRGANSIRYIYDATGRKLSQLTIYGGSSKLVDYDGELQYEDNALQFINHEEGRIVVSSTKLIYYNSGELTSNVTQVNTTLTGAVPVNGEKYLKAVVSGTTLRSGLFPIGGTFSVVPGGKYKVRVKGFRDKGSAANSNPAYFLFRSRGQDLSSPGAMLPQSLPTTQTEAWTEQTITIPGGVDTLQFGIVWNNVLNGEAMYINEIEISKLDLASSEYQYHLKDHLDNVRVTFTTKTAVDQTVATLESANAANEQSQFIYYNEAVKINSPLFDHTDQSGSNPGIFFYRGFNFNGPSAVIDGNPWVAGATATNFSWTGGGSFENQSIPLIPATDATKTNMLRASLYGDVTMITTNVPNGTYDIYLYVWEDSYTQDYIVSVEGVVRLPNYNSGTPGIWTKLGPFRTPINDGNIVVFASGICNISGLEIFTVNQPATNQAPVVTTYLNNKGAIEGQAFSYSFPSHTFLDPDIGGSLTYTAALSSGSAIPAWLTFNSTTRSFSGTPTAGSAGFYDIRVTASDGLGGTVSDVFTLNITALGTTTFYRGLNLNGPATTIDGNSWLSGNSNPNFTHSNTSLFEDQAITLSPVTDVNRAAMIRSSIFGNFPTLNVTAIANGLYDVYIYVWEDNSSETFSIAIEGSLVLSNYMSGAPGRWERLGPFRTMIGDGTINITSSGGTANFSGIEIRSVTTTNVAATSISITSSSNSVIIGKSMQLNRTIAPSNATNRSVSWSSSNPSIATVNNDGWVSGIAPGTVTITASLAGLTSQASVTVTKVPSSYSTRLTGGTTNEKFGLAKSLSVMPGDIITAEVWAKYLDSNQGNWKAVLSNLMTTIAQGTAPYGTFVDGGLAGSIGNAIFPYPTSVPRTNDNGTGPKVYLNYIVFDKDFNVKTGGFDRLSSVPKEDGSDVPHERLAFDGPDQIVITEPGYVYLYISNENPTAIEAYFDDFKVTQSKGPIVSSQDYYAFGMAMASYQRENVSPNLLLFNNKELQDELALNTYDFGWRQYDASIARWLVIDPLADKRHWLNPYNYVQNNPIIRFDPNGLTDFTLSKTTGEVKQIGNTNNDPDRILKTYKSGVVKRKGDGLLGGLVKASKRGDAKVAVDNISKGILKDGANFQTKSNTIAVGDEGQPTVEGIRDFVLKLSNYVNKEVGGHYLSNISSNKTNYVAIGAYDGNDDQNEHSGLVLQPSLLGKVIVTVDWHTHLSKFGDSDRLVPSGLNLPGGDMQYKRNQAPYNPQLKFIIITNPSSTDHRATEIQY